MAESKPTVAFVGVGRMGSNMALRLNDCGYTVASVIDTNQHMAMVVANEVGCQVADSLAAASASADVIITVVTNDQSMRDIYMAEGDNLLEGAAGKLFINCATLSPAIHREVDAAVSAAGAEALEACMASSITQARDGTLYLMTAGSNAAQDRAAGLLADLGEVRRIGSVGQAAEVKALVNMVMNINTAGLAEGLGLADALGLDLDMVMEVFSQTGANSRVLETDGEDMRDRDHEVYFSADHAAKDSGIALDLAAEEGLELPLAAATKAQFVRLMDAGKGELDKSAVAELTFKGRN